MVNLPFISCLSLTYGRYWHLEEAVESYLRQDYAGQSELVIVNDMPDQTINVEKVELRQPGQSVRVVNLPRRLVPNNLKFDKAVELAQGELCCFWDDDDISLPHRLTVSSRYMTDGCPYWTIPWRYHLDMGASPWLCDRGLHGGDMFRRDAYLACGGSSGAPGHNDQVVYARMKALPGYLEAGSAQQCFYVYRWAGITAHHSAYGESVHHCMAQFDRTVRSDSRFRTGEIIIEPHYKQDYEGLCARALTAWEIAQ